MPELDDSINDEKLLETLETHVASHPPHVEIATFPGQGHNLHRTGFDDERRPV